jgi:tetratricopeptide (TPR) repeat protein
MISKQLKIRAEKFEASLSTFYSLLSTLFLASVFLLSLYKIDDTDTWMHLSFGRLIWELKGIPAKEPFIYPGFDSPASYTPCYTPWLFALIYYMILKAFNIYGVILLKAITVTTAFFILLKDSIRPHRNYIVAIAVMTMVVLASWHRFEDRPDIFLMVFLSFSIFSLNAFIYENKKYIYILPLIHLLWANSHSSINLMFVPFGAFLAGGIIQKYINKRISRYNPPTSPFNKGGQEGDYKRGVGGFSCTPTAAQLKTILLIFVLSLASSMINPNFIGQFTYGYQVLSSDWWRQTVAELRPPTWKTEKWPYLMTGAVVLSFILNWFAFYRSRFTASPPFNSPLGKGGHSPPFNSPLGKGGHRGVKEGPGASLIHLILVIPFIILSFTALRFIFLLGIVAGPILIRNISPFFHFADQGVIPPHPPLVKGGRGDFRLNGSRIVAVLLSIWIILYTSLSIMKVGPFHHKLKEFGFGINYIQIPEGALKYMDKKGIEGRIFNTFHWGGYITWRDFPRRLAFIDGRGYLSDDLLERWSLAQWIPSVLDELYRTYGFESVLLEFRSIEGISESLSEADNSLLSPDWALVYWDDQSLLYLRRGGRYDPVIKEDEYRFIRPANSVYDIKVARLKEEYYRSNLIREIKRNIEETASSKAYAFLGFIHNETGLYREAIDIFSKVRDFPLLSHLLDAYKGTAYAYGNLGYIDESIKHYKKALSIKKEANTYYNLGILYTQKGDKEEAIRYLKKALDSDSKLLEVYPALIGIYNELGMEGDARKTLELHERAKVSIKAEEYYRNGIKACREKRFDIAAEEFKRSIEVNPTNPAPYSSLGQIYYYMGMIDRAFEYQKRALNIDPDFPNAHYRLALVYKKWGDSKMAKRHGKEYLRNERYLSPEAKRELRELP